VTVEKYLISTAEEDDKMLLYRRLKCRIKCGFYKNIEERT